MGNVCAGKQYPHDACQYNSEGEGTKIKLVRGLKCINDGTDVSNNTVLMIIFLMGIVILVALVGGFRNNGDTGNGDGVLRKDEAVARYVNEEERPRTCTLSLSRKGEDMDVELGM